MPQPILSVVIPTYNRCQSVIRELQALVLQTEPADNFEVIVSIDGSEDGTREAVQAFTAPFQIQCIWQPNRGRAAACNTGIKAAHGSVIVLLDDDMEPAPDCLAKHIQAHPVGSCVGAIGAVPIYSNDGNTSITTYIMNKFNSHLDNLAQTDHQLSLRDFYSGHFSIRRDVLNEVGLFDEAFRIYGNEDLELSLRLLSAGVKLYYAADIIAYQHYLKDFAGLARDTIAKGRTAVLLASKHPEALPHLQLGTYYHRSWRWRWVRSILLTLSRWWPSLPNQMITVVQWLEHRQVKFLPVVYQFVLDYLFWFGARAALYENQKTGQGLKSLGDIHNL